MYMVDMTPLEAGTTQKAATASTAARSVMAAEAAKRSREDEGSQKAAEKKRGVLAAWGLGLKGSIRVFKGFCRGFRGGASSGIEGLRSFGGRACGFRASCGVGFC